MTELKALGEMLAYLKTVDPEKLGIFTTDNLPGYFAACDEYEAWKKQQRFEHQSKEEVGQKGQLSWQPIETAPKDGRTLLLGRFNECGNWRTMRGEWMSQGYIDEYWEDPDVGEPGWFETSVEADETPNCWPTSPTHWMPLPSSPKKENDA